MQISLVRKLIFIPIVIVALFFASMLIRSKKSPKAKTGTEIVSSVKSLIIDRATVIPHAVGYGQAQPAKVWKAIVEVGGEIVWKADRLNNGQFFHKGDPLIRIDKIPWELAVVQAKASVAQSEAKIAELIATKANLEATLKIREQMVSFSEKELQRMKQLFQKKTISASDVDKEELSVLTQKNSLQTTKSDLNLLPKKIAYEQGQLKVAKANLEKAELDLARTEIVAPFDCRIASVNAELTQYVRAGDSLLECDWIGRSEVEAQLDSAQFFVLMSRGARRTQDNQPPRPPAERFKVVIGFKSGDREFSWPARCDRIDSEIDPETRTVGFVASVDDTYKFARTRNNLPLVKGMFCSVTVYGEPKENVIVVPRSSIHGDVIYVVDKDSRLRMRKVKADFSLLEYTVIESGIEPGEELVVSDVVPAIEGMKLSTFKVEDFYSDVEKEIGVKGLPSETGNGSSSNEASEQGGN